MSSSQSQPRPAATVVLMRDSESGPQVLLTRRPQSMRFMGGATVFPGGAVADADRHESWEQASALDRHQAGEMLAMPEEDALGAFVCAVRETYEEVGLLLSSGGIAAGRDAAQDPDTFRRLCLDSGVTLRTDLLVSAGSWVTPLGAPVRFDARFFVTKAPEGWEPEPDPSEVEAAFWMTPAEALVGMSSGNVLMAPPTIEMLQRLDGHSTVDDAIASVAGARMTGAGSVISVRMSPLVHLVLAPNPGVMTGPGTNTYIVGSGPTVIIDPAVDDTEYIDAVLAAAPSCAAILVTHRHSDHVGGVAGIAERTGAVVHAFGSSPAGGVDVSPIDDGATIEIGGVTLRAIYAPGHASDHLCFHLEAAASLFAGDNILGEGTAVIAPPDGDMRAYMDTLHRLQSFYIDRIYPGHFRPLDGGSQVIADYIEHRKARGRAILDAVTSGASTEEEIVSIVYVDTPPALHPVAQFSVRAHLDMLAAEGLVTKRDGRWSSLPAE